MKTRRCAGFEAAICELVMTKTSLEIHAGSWLWIARENKGSPGEGQCLGATYFSPQDVADRRFSVPTISVLGDGLDATA